MSTAKELAVLCHQRTNRTWGNGPRKIWSIKQSTKLFDKLHTLAQESARVHAQANDIKSEVV